MISTFVPQDICLAPQPQFALLDAKSKVFASIGYAHHVASVATSTLLPSQQPYL
jgi:hypothetical protein